MAVAIAAPFVWPNINAANIITQIFLLSADQSISEQYVALFAVLDVYSLSYFSVTAHSVLRIVSTNSLL